MPVRYPGVPVGQKFACPRRARCITARFSAHVVGRKSRLEDPVLYCGRHVPVPDTAEATGAIALTHPSAKQVQAANGPGKSSGSADGIL